MTEGLLKLIRDSEGLSLTAYLCPAGYWTQGYGRRVKQGSPPISKGTADRWLQEDAAKAERQARKLAPKLFGNRLAALTDLCFNVGMGALDGDDPEDINDDAGVVKALRAENWIDAANRFRQWKHARVGGVLKELPGLVKRREVGARWILEG